MANDKPPTIEELNAKITELNGLLDKMSNAKETLLAENQEAITSISASLEKLSKKVTKGTPIDINHIQKEYKEDSYDLRAIKTENLSNRSKWLMGVFGAFLFVASNDAFTDIWILKLIITLGCILGVVILAFAIVNFEEHLIRVKRSLITGKKGDEIIDKDTNIYDSAQGKYNFSFVIIFIIGILVIYGLLDGKTHWITCLIDKNYCINQNERSKVFGTYTYYDTDIKNKCNSVKHSLILQPDSSYSLITACSDTSKHYVVATITGRWKRIGTMLYRFTSSKDSSFNLKIITDSSVSSTTVILRDSILSQYNLDKK